MELQETLNTLYNTRYILPEKFNVSSLAIFGDITYDNQKLDSDEEIDIIISFKGESSTENFLAVMFYLESLLDTKIGLTTYQTLPTENNAKIHNELIHVWGERKIALH